jgi:hypothetical protein
MAGTAIRLFCCGEIKGLAYMIAVFAFWACLAFTALSLFALLGFPGIPDPIQIEGFGRLYYSYGLLFLNIACGSYLVYFFSCLDAKPHRIFSVGFFFSLSLMFGSGGAMSFSFEVFENDILKLAFGNSHFTWIVCGIAACLSAWMAGKFWEKRPS